MHQRLTAYSLTLVFSFFVGWGVAQERLVIAYEGGGVTLDPHMRTENTTWSWQRHIFDTITWLDREGELEPRIAVSWDNVDPTEWHLEVRNDVTFHDGTTMTAEDVAFSIERAATHPRSEKRLFVGQVVESEAIDDYTVRVVTRDPDPVLPLNLAHIGVVPKAMLEDIGDEAFARDPIGTGPYRFISWQEDEQLDLEVYEEYWGPRPDFDSVRLTNIPSGSARLAALLTGEVQVAQKILPQDFPRVEDDPNTYLSSTPGIRVIYMTMDYWRESGSDGLAADMENPFLDRRVRQAVYQAIDVDAIVDIIMEGAATPATQLAPPAVEIHDPDLERLPYDPDAARELLAEAGYEDGFTLRFDAPNDRYLNDEFVAEAVAGMLQEVGLEAQVNAETRTVFFPRIDEGNYTMFLAGWGWPSPYATIVGFLHCRDDDLGLGSFNRARYCNPEVDELLAEAASSFDDEARIEVARQALYRANREDFAWIPLYYENVIEGVQSHIEWQSRPDEFIFAFEMQRGGE